MDDFKTYELTEEDVKDYVSLHGTVNPLDITEEGRIHLLMTGVMVNDIEVVRSCLDNNVDSSNPKLLENSAYYGYYEIVKLLLENGADPTHAGCWPLKISQIRGHYKTHNLIKQYLRRYKLNQLIKK